MEVTLPPPTTLAAHPFLLGKPTPQCKAALQTPAELEHADFLAIDDLLDFSNEDIGGLIEPSNASSCEVKVDGPSASATFEGQLSTNACEFDSLCAPCDDLAELEWLSNFVEECFSSNDAPSCLGNFAAYMDLGDNATPAHGRISTSSGSGDLFRTTSPVSVLETNVFSTEKHCSHTFSFSPDVFVPGRARSKRCRTAVCFWNTRILCPEVSESLLETASTTYTTRAGSSESMMYNSYYNEEDDNEDEAHASDHVDNAAPFACFSPNKIAKNPSMKLKKSCYRNSKSSIKHPSRKSKKVKVDNPTSLRKCLHCATQKTPQWRAGPMGPKTLCNACGVRFKSGRLCEEYRPAASPTFIERMHSNSHRKVLEMRRQRCEIGNGHESHKHNGSSLNWGASEVSLGCAVAATDDGGSQYPASKVKAETTNGQ